MDKLYSSLFLIGFRNTGKSTIGGKVAKKLGWDIVEMDDELVKRAGRSVAEITKNGTFWQEFRQMEQDLLKDLLHRERVVVSTGGGAPVNNIVKEGTTSTFGELNAQLLKDAVGVLTVLVTASDDKVGKRIREFELRKKEITHPILDEKRAKEVEALLEEFRDNEAKKKEIMVDEIVKDSLKMFSLRKPLYGKLSKYVVDTSNISIDEAVEKVLGFF